MIKYILLEEAAVDELVSNRSFQTLDFELGKALYSLITGVIKKPRLPSVLKIVELQEGIAIVAKNYNKDSNFLVIDVEQSQLFSLNSDSRNLLVFQKILRFSKKMWQDLSYNFSEKIISQSSKAVLFPFGYETKPYRVVIERSPLKSRLEKRGYGGKFLLVYKTGRESADAQQEIAEEKNFRKVFDKIDDIYRGSRTANDDGIPEGSHAGPVAVSMLQPFELSGNSSIFKSYEDWEKLLTQSQKHFVESEIIGPHRIEGAAGTGKTLCLMLKAVARLRVAESRENTMHAAFVTHSDATKRSISEFLTVIDHHDYQNRNRHIDSISLKVCTLSELCAEQLSQQISESEFIDRDALESKGTQLLYFSEAIADAIKDDFPSHERFMSQGLKDFIRDTDNWTLAEMFQHEISVIIKGRASESIDVYKKIPSLKYGIPINGEADKGFIFAVFRIYQSKLGEAAQFDTDDVVLTTIGQLDTPIWRRRRVRDGYDAVFIDETHLFNINELHVFHHFTKTEGPYPIIYSVDRTQAVGDHGWTNSHIAKALEDVEASSRSVKLQTVFRSAPQIVDLAFSVVSSGATLFTNFDNPLEAATSSFTAEEERLSATPIYRSYPNQERMIEGAFERAEAILHEIDCRRGDLLIVTFDNNIINDLQSLAESRNKPHSILKRRGDVNLVEAAQQNGHFVIGHVDYVGGLEFKGVVIVGCDVGRMPPLRGDDTLDSRNFLSYSSHNRLYVAISRARYRVELLGEKSRGPSNMLKVAIDGRIVEQIDEL